MTILLQTTNTTTNTTTHKVLFPSSLSKTAKKSKSSGGVKIGCNSGSRKKNNPVTSLSTPATAIGSRFSIGELVVSYSLMIKTTIHMHRPTVSKT